MQAREEQHPVYAVPRTEAEEDIIRQALNLLRSRLGERGTALVCPQDTRDYLTLQLAGEESEKFAVILLDSAHRVLGYEVLFHGTIDAASVYPRELVKLALRYNAAAVIVAHNHPSGNAEASRADIQLAKRLREALAMIDVRVIDSMVVGGCQNLQFQSMAEAGYF